MSRAKPLPADERRAAILDAVLPLVVQHGRAVSTRQIAEASGIAEGTIFRVFDSKSDLIDQAIRRAVAPESILAALAALPERTDLREAVVDIVATLQSHARTAHRLIGLLAPAGTHAPKDAAARREMGERTVAAIAERLASHTDALGTEPREAAAAILALSFGSTFSSPAPTPAGVADILLTGITRNDEA